MRTEQFHGEDLRDLLDCTFLMPSFLKYVVFKVTAEYVARPDLISLEKYGNTDFVDVICKVNGISNPFELNEGDIIVLPSYDCLASFVYTNDNIEQTDKDNDEHPTPKKRNEKRKANEAIIGDKRFKIDKERRAVIY